MRSTMMALVLWGIILCLNLDNWTIWQILLFSAIAGLVVGIVFRAEFAKE